MVEYFSAPIIFVIWFLKMRFSLFVLISAAVLPAVRAQNPDVDSTQTLYDLIHSRADTQLVFHRLQIPALLPIKQLLSDTTTNQQYTIFLPTNDALIQSAQGVFESFCEQSDHRINDDKMRLEGIKHKPLKSTINSSPMPPVTDMDCQNLYKMVVMDDRLMKNIEKARRVAYYVKQMDLSNQYQQLRFSQPIEKVFLAIAAYHTVPQTLNVEDIQPNTNQVFKTLASSNSFDLGNFNTQTKLVLSKGSEGGLSIVFASPLAPVCCADIVNDSTTAGNGKIFFINQAFGLPYSVGHSLIYNRLFITHALLNYTGLLNEIDQGRNITVLATTDQGWLNSLPHLLQDREIKRMIGLAARHFERLFKLPITRVLMKRAAFSDHPQIERYKPAIWQTGKLLERLNSENDTSGEGDTVISREALRRVLSNHVTNGVYFSSDLKSKDSVITKSGQTLPVTTESVNSEMGEVLPLMIGDARLIYPDIPVFNGALHVIDRVIQA